MSNVAPARQTLDARTKLLNAAMTVFRERGYAGTTVDQLCAAAQVTKGAFFHHFESKEALGVAAADYWSQSTSRLFEQASFHEHADPLDRILGYLELRKSLIKGALPEFTCLVGTLVQETFDTSPSIRAACERSISQHVAALEQDFAAALRKYRIASSADSLALYTQAVIQGAFIVAKAKNSRAVAAACIDHLIRDIKTLFLPRPGKAAKAPAH